MQFVRSRMADIHTWTTLFFQVLPCCSQVITSNSGWVLLHWTGMCHLHDMWKNAERYYANIQCLGMKPCIWTYSMLSGQGVWDNDVSRAFGSDVCGWFFFVDFFFSLKLLYHLCNQTSWISPRVVMHWTGCPRRCGCPIPTGIQGHAGCGSGQPGLVVGDPAHSRGLELDGHCGHFQPRPFSDSMS